ncbi:MAG TPA: alpha-2-macroglobulin family protein [Chitinophaga sp.]|uniref:alpha-2-macroglobulin family protein n=1 Tax=Chitinophaga sp. TaxID=1869181 RepID=UPI002DBA3C26|nr:alpha-2-macroglobulin family protein [Chitinophaga sp.]HEU4554902.1 alpha-2-macroglobulin family protein [Chitinophaga sp.]
MAQYNYNKEWKKVTELEDKGLPQSALQAVTGIYEQAVKDGREAEIIKSLIFRMKYQANEENGEITNLETISRQLQQFKGPVYSILASMKGEMLWNYLQSNRYRLYHRTAMAADTAGDVSSWSMERLNHEIAAAYNTSLENTAGLQKTNLAAYDEILEKGNTRALRPTLYDLLAHRALSYFKSGETNLAQPADLFELDDAQAFAPAADFAAHTFTAADTTSLQFKALQLLQALIAFHEKDNSAALLDVDLERIAYVNQVGIMADKDTLYVKALQHMQQAYAKQPEVTRVTYMLAQYYYQQDQQEKDSATGKAVMAAALCRQAIQQAPDSYGAGRCRQLLRQIEARGLQLTSELVNLPDQPFRTLVTYRNLQRIYLRVVRVNESFRHELRNAQNDYRDTTNRYWRLITGRKALRQWEQSLPDPADYRQHRTEIKTGALPLGQYVLLAATTPDFGLDSSMLAVQFIHVSQLSYISRGRDNYLVLHRESGAPLTGVQLKVWQMVNNRNGSTSDKLLQTAATGANGQVTLKNIPDRQSFNIRLQWTLGKDTLFTDNYQYLYSYYPAVDNKPPHPQSFLFTDRAIYRPGQTVYFKGIVVKKAQSGKGGNAIPGLTTLLQLRNVNGEKVDSIQVTTNDYGAYNGAFKLPEGTLNGRFSIYDTTAKSEVGFAVEEYKRPKFYVEFDTVKGSYRIGDTVTVHGKALAYAGNNINGAQVKYRVVREARYPYYWMFMFRPAPASASREIAHGQLQTGEDGTFTIHFAALPDKQVKPELKPIFTYRVYADVTDLNGETRSGEQRVAAGYQLLEVKLDVPDVITGNNLEQVKITTANLGGAFEPATVQVRLLPLQAPDRLIRPRYWEAPDQFVLSEQAFLQAFPLDEYKHENEPAQWPRKAPVLEKTFTTANNSSAALAVKTLPAGVYELEVTATDKLGGPVTEKKIFSVVNPAAPQLPYPAYFSNLGGTESYEPGTDVKLVAGTTAKDLHILQSIERWNQEPEDKFVQLSAAQKAFTYPVTEKDRGGFRITYTAVKDNRLFSWTHDIQVPWDNKTLDVQVATHRDKLLPGEKEKWQVKIKGYKKDQVAAALLATMYDASLDAFTPHQWQAPRLYPTFMPGPLWQDSHNFTEEQSFNHYPPAPPVKDSVITYDALSWFDWRGGGYGGYASRESASAVGVRIRGVVSAAAPPAPTMAAPANADNMREMKRFDANAVATAQQAETPAAPPATVMPRKNFNETAFFYPDLHTDKDGNITFEFTVPEALTRWRFMGLAHTKDMAFGYTETSIVTQKPLMVQPNAPRFMREGDRMEFSAKISNLADSTLIGQARLELLDAATMQPVDGWFQNTFPVQHFTAYKGQSTVVTFPVQVPYHFNSALLYRVVAQSGSFSDGEENALPVLTNSMLVTETLPLAMRGNGERTFTFDKLLHSDTSETLQQHALTVEFTGNPAWYAVQALPYLMEYPHQCAEQIFNRYYANALATHIANALPGIKAVFEQWRTKDTAALQSNLQKNEELKAVLLQQTPWVLEARNEAEQQSRIALLFDLHRMSGELAKALGQLKEMQLPSGAFPWFNGMWEDRFITQYIITGIGRLQQVGALSAEQRAGCRELTDKALAYLDMQLDKDYHQLLKEKADMKKQHISSIQVHYLYMRSFFKDKPLPAKYNKAYDYYLGQAKKFWVQQNRFAQAMAAVALHRQNDGVTPADILKSLKENAITSEEMGMYWKTQPGYWWYQAPIETQAMLIEAFEVVAHDTAAADAMKTWLLKNKQTNSWHTTKATADACYAMLLGGSSWLAANPQVTIQLGNAAVSNTSEPAAAGTGYFKKRLEGREVKPAMGHIQVTLQGSQGQPSWGAVYWQYFERLDKITPSQTPLQLEKQLFIQHDTDKGPVLTAITGNNRLKVGDKVKVRIVLRADRDMEYIHLQDMRAACFEPQNVISSSKWQNGLSYYESTKDASTDFFFSRLPKGTHVFEYTLFATHEGDFSNGISTVQCMYAPEFSAHSAGMNVKVEK